MRDPSLRQLEALIAVVETGTVSQAARLLGISQPAASKLIIGLQADLGLKLLRRQAGRLIPTRSGIRFYEEVMRVFGGVNQLARMAETIRREETRRLVIGVPLTLSGAFVARALSGFITRHADIAINFEAQDCALLADAVLSRRLDVALITGGYEDPSLRVQRLLSPSLSVLLPQGHGLSDKSELTLEDIAKERFISLPPSSLPAQMITRCFATRGLQQDAIISAMTVSDIVGFVALGLGVAIVDPLSMEGLPGDRIATRPLYPVLSHDYHIICPGYPRSNLVDDLMESLRAAVESDL